MTNPSPSKPSPPSSSSSFSESSVEVSRKRVIELHNKLNSIVIGHEDMTKAILVAAVAREHSCLYSGHRAPQSTYTIHAFAKLVNASFYQYLLTKFTTFDEIVGPVDVLAMTRGEYRRN